MDREGGNTESVVAGGATLSVAQAVIAVLPTGGDGFREFFESEFWEEAVRASAHSEGRWLSRLSCLIVTAKRQYELPERRLLKHLLKVLDREEFSAHFLAAFPEPTRAQIALFGDRLFLTPQERDWALADSWTGRTSYAEACKTYLAQLQTRMGLARKPVEGCVAAGLSGDTIHGLVPGDPLLLRG